MSSFNKPAPGRVCYGKCLRCSKVNKISRKEINSARGARCPDCGGPMELSKEQQERVQHAAAMQQIDKDRKGKLTNRE